MSIGRAHAEADLLIAESPRFARIAAGRRRVVEVLFFYGSGDLLICRQDGPTLQWSSGFAHLGNLATEA